MRIKKGQSNLTDRLKTVWVFGLIGLVFIYFLYIGLEENLRAALLDRNSIKTKAVITDERHFWGNGPVSNDFSYYYKFTVDNKIYKGKSWDKELNVGDTLEIEYVEIHPSFNRPTNKGERHE